MENYIKNYPRPQMIREDWLLLDGQWDFSFDDQDEGQGQKWFATPRADKKITVPFTYETKLSGIGEESPHDVVWYYKSLTAKQTDKQTILHFEGSDYHTKLWVNGIFIGENQGGYFRFSFDITHALTKGENTIAVRVADSLDRTQPRGKQRWITENFGCWYVQTTGIWKSVWLEYAPKARIGQLKMTPNIQKGMLDIHAEISCGQGYTLEAVASFAGVEAGRMQVPVKEGVADFALDVTNKEIDEWGIKTWWPQSPHLYDLNLRLVKDGTEIDKVGSYFGMREIAIHGNKVLLNGVALYQRLILDQGYWKDSHLTPPSEDALVEDIDKCMAMGYNGVRKHMKVEDERFLYWADRKGFLVWSEFPATYLFNDLAVERVCTEWMRIVRQNYNHPSIIVWTPFNESWGVPNIRTSVQQQSLTQAIYYVTKAMDAMRPVICNDGWEHTISDIITLHDYEERGETFLARYTDQKTEIFEGTVQHNRDRYAFAKGFVYQGQPVLLSEYGGIAFNNGESGWGYGNKVNTEQDFIDRFKSITHAVKQLDYCCGFCYTQVTDVQQEQNGLMDIDRNFKIDPEIIKKINLG